MKNESNSSTITPLEYLNTAKKYYQNLCPNFTASGNTGYWMLGCILDSMLDFLNLAGSNGVVSYDDGRKFLNDVATSYLNNQKQGAWYDDWGWWGNATAKVFSPAYAKLFAIDQTLKNNFTTICKQTFTFMMTGKAPYTSMDPNYTGTLQAYTHAKQMAKEYPGQGWEQIVTGAEPLWNIGCWQAPMIPNSPLHLNPFNETLGPFQDSVINELFYLITQRTLNHGLGTQQEVDEMTSFYKNWMTQNNLVLKSEQRIFNALEIGAGLFRERVSIYKNGSPVNGYSPNLSWTGDQGLMLCALTNLYYSQSGPQQQETLYLIKATINGVFNYALGNIDANHSNVIMPWCNIGLTTSQQPGPPPGNDYGDYFSGTGIFMRGLLEASGIPEIKQLISFSDKQQKLSNTLAALLDGTKYMDFIFSNNDPVDSHRWFDDFNKMATLVAASQLLFNS